MRRHAHARFRRTKVSFAAVTALVSLAGGTTIASALVASPAHGAASCVAPRAWHVVITHRPGYGNQYTLVCR
jgi:hypothetical protein